MLVRQNDLKRLWPRGWKMEIKRGFAWFPFPIRCHTAITDLSDGAFKLFVYLCLNADQQTAQLSFRQTVLARMLGKSRRSLAGYLNELQERQICIVQMGSNQHAGGRIQIQEAYWPYEMAPAATTDGSQDSYLQEIQSYL